MDEQQRNFEILKVMLDVFKHVTTLSAAGTAALLAIYQGQILGKGIVIATLVLFGLSAFLGLLGMHSAVTDMSSTVEVSRTTSRAFTAAEFTLLLAVWGIISVALRTAFPWEVLLFIAAVSLIVWMWRSF